MDTQFGFCSRCRPHHLPSIISAFFSKLDDAGNLSEIRRSFMSASENRKQRQSKLRGDQTGDDDNDGGEEDDKEQQGEEQEEDGGSRCNGVCGEKEKEVGRKGVFGISRDFRSAIKRTFGRRRKVKENATADGENRRSPSSRGCGGGFYGCFMPPMTEECPETPTSDPNSERFSFEMLRALIESNDFYCEESNPHI